MRYLTEMSPRKMLVSQVFPDIDCKTRRTTGVCAHQSQSISQKAQNRLLAKMRELKAAGTGDWIEALLSSLRYSIR